jgi:hypothetical protein
MARVVVPGARPVCVPTLDQFFEGGREAQFLRKFSVCLVEPDVIGEERDRARRVIFLITRRALFFFEPRGDV